MGLAGRQNPDSFITITACGLVRHPVFSYIPFGYNNKNIKYF